VVVVSDILTDIGQHTHLRLSLELMALSVGIPVIAQILLERFMKHDHTSYFGWDSPVF